MRNINLGLYLADVPSAQLRDRACSICYEFRLYRDRSTLCTLLHRTQIGRGSYFKSTSEKTVLYKTSKPTIVHDRTADFLSVNTSRRRDVSDFEFRRSLGSSSGHRWRLLLVWCCILSILRWSDWSMTRRSRRLIRRRQRRSVATIRGGQQLQSSV